MESKERIKEIVEFSLDNGDSKTIETFNIKESSLERYKREYKKNICSDKGSTDLKISGSLQKIKEIYSEKELESIAKGGRLVPGYAKVPIIDFSGERIRFGALSDTHEGSQFFDESCYDAAIAEFKKEGCEFIAHTGDVTEGMSNRPGHIYELNKIGYDAQFQYAKQQFEKWDKPWYTIDGNHDRWFLKSNGALLVKHISEILPNVNFIGHDEGDISLKGETTIKLWHGDDSGGSYAISYRPQKIVESFTGGEKPGILITGHDHKAGYFFIRNVHVFEAGAMSKQSKWMRSTKKENHFGFWIIDAWVKNKSIRKITSTFYPFYM